ncbi:bifunctional solanapyrone synthase [Delitschia confertaspora ATCC 74209]|uniref:Bifunctional solanapyrone synthase n=1 Tax=Delitschia confertaspora ATCC 74209 TaxID=1513339 RepID=A0A9P4MP35_9PLEO|nr:bifunctional solanapyrone synthase [Delitschia confertaspora ATCC 74209]
MNSKSFIFCIAWLASFFFISTQATPASNSNDTDQFLSSIGLSTNSLKGNTYKLRGPALACAILEAFQSSLTEFPFDDALYVAESEGHWSATAWATPTCIFNPSSVNHVSIAVRVLTFTGTKFAIRSGGHSPLSQWANINNGVLISMSKFTDLRYDASSKTVTTGFGNRWGAVYDYLEQFGRLAVGGRVSSVGSALTIGGGLSHMSNRYGLSVDNVISFEVVLASGAAVTASSTSNPDLFWALKGGSNNFGIVTRMTLKTYPVGKVWGGQVIYNNTLYQDDLMRACAEYQKNGQSDKDTAMLTYLVTSNKTVFATYVHMGGKERPEAFKPFFDIPVLVDSTKLYDNFTALINDNVVDTVVPRWTWGMTNFYLDEKLYEDVSRICTEEAKKVSQINGGTYAVMPQPISKSMVDASQNNENALNLRSRPQLWFSLNVGWTQASDDATALSIVRSTIDRVEALAKSRNLHDPYVFLNDAAPYQKVIQSYGPNNLQKMKAVGNKYDPTGVFQTLVPGGFKISA